jgi:hypothetical protein
LKNEFADLENEKDRITSRMKELNHQGHNNQSTFDRLNKKYDVQESIGILPKDKLLLEEV